MRGAFRGLGYSPAEWIASRRTSAQCSNSGVLISSVTSAPQLVHS
jgi:hypothetical protein